MSIKNLFNSPGTPKIQKTVTSDQLVDQVESSDFVEAKRKQYDEFIPPIDFSTASNFAKFGSAELYYEKAFERIHNYYPYDGTLHEKIEFENSSSYLDKYVLENLYPRTNGYINFSGSTHISVFGGPHTASVGMDGKLLDSTFDLSMKYDEEKKRTSAFEFRGEDGITAEFWFKTPNTNDPRTILHISGASSNGEIEVFHNNSGELRLIMKSGSASITRTFTSIPDTNWNHYAVSALSSSSGISIKGYRNGQLVSQVLETAKNIPSILPVTNGIDMRVGNHFSASKQLTGSLDEFRFWKTARTPEDIFNTWFIPVGGGTNKHDSNIALSCYFKFNEGITGDSSLDKKVLDYSGRINNGIFSSYSANLRETGSAITEKLNQSEFKDPIIYSSHPDVVSKKAEYKASGSLADLENNSMFFNYFPAWMQEEDEQNGKQLKNLSQVLGSYFDTVWHQISFLDKIHDRHFISGSNKPLPFAKKLLYDKGFVLPDLLSDVTKIEYLRQKDDNEIFEKEINEIKNTIYHNVYSNMDAIYKSKGTEKSFRNYFRSLGIGQEVVRLNKYADNSTFVLRNNYEFRSYERKFLDFNVEGHNDATIYQTSSANNSNIYIPGDTNYTGSFTLQAEVILPRKQKNDEPNFLPYQYLTSSIFGYHTGTSYTHPTLPDGLQAFVVHSTLESNLNPNDKQRIKFVLTGSNINLETGWYWGQYENNKWSLAVRLKHASYPTTNITGSSKDDYLLEFYGVEADGNTERNSFLLTTSSVAHSYYSSNKIFYAGAHNSNFTGSTLHYSDVKLSYVRYWHSYLSNDAIKQHAFDSETFGANEPFEQDLVNVYPVEIPREKTLALHWAFHDLTASNSSGQFLVSDLSSGSSDSNYGSLSNTIQRYVAARGVGFNNSTSKIVDKNFLYSARKRLPDDLMSSDLVTIKDDESRFFFVDEDVSDNFYSFEKSMWGAISNEMMNIFSTALDLNALIGQPSQKYHHRYNLADFLRDRFFEDVENEPDIEKFTSLYRWIDDSISLSLKQLIPASTRFSEKINNIIESHVLERNKLPEHHEIVAEFREGFSTEGSIRGVTEMNYNWQFGHAPESPSERANEANHVLWQQDRLKKSGLREVIRNSRNNHSLQSSGLIRKQVDGTVYLSDTYAARKFSKVYDFNLNTRSVIHGGVNFDKKKNLHLFHESVAPAGRVESVPQNIVTIGVGPGQGIVQEPPNNDQKPRKKKYNVDALIGNRAANEYGYKLLGDFFLPINFMSGTVESGFNSAVHTSYSSGVHFTNLHNDIVGGTNDIPMQGPFTERHVGGLQYRHIDLNTGTDTESSRPEGWRILLKDHPSGFADASADGAIGFVGPDYESPYPSSNLQKANRYRDEHVKRPVNIRNIKTTVATPSAGNYANELEIFSVSPTFQKTWLLEAYGNPSLEILPTFISSALPFTTHYHSLLGIAPFTSGNIFGGGKFSKRQPDATSLVVIPAVAGGTSSGSFSMYGLKFAEDDDRLLFGGLKIGGASPYGLELDPDNDGASIGGHIAILTGSSNADLWNNTKTALETLNYIVNTSSVAGETGSSFIFPNEVSTSGYLFMTSSLNHSFSGSDDFSVSIWFRKQGASPATQGYLFNFMSSSYSETTAGNNGVSAAAYIDGSEKLFFYIGGSQTGGSGWSQNFKRYDSIITAAVVGEWHHLLFTSDGSTNLSGIKVYGDGQLLSENGSGNLLENASGTAIGQRDGLVRFFNALASPSVGRNSNELKNVDIGDMAYFNSTLSSTNVSMVYNQGHLVNLTQSSFSSFAPTSWYKMGAHPNDIIDVKDVSNTDLFLKDAISSNDLSGEKGGDTRSVVSGSGYIYPDFNNFFITASSQNSIFNGLVEIPVNSPSIFFNISAPAGGVTPVAGVTVSSYDNVITVPRTDLTSSERNILTRFSAPGGPEIQSIGYLDAHTTTYSVHNAIPFRNLSILGSGSGEPSSIRVEDELGKRRGLRTLRTLRAGQFGIDSQYGQIVSSDYPSSGSFNKQHPNRSKRMEYSGLSIITGSTHDNMHINTPIPRSELQYSWIRNATFGKAGAPSGAPNQRILGYAPRNGVVSSSAGYVEAIVFPSASSIIGS